MEVTHELHGLKLFFSQAGLPTILFFLFPFLLLLFCIAVLPLRAPHFWESNLRKSFLSVGIALPMFVFLLVQEWHALEHVLLDYAAFIALLTALFTIAGGIYVRGSFSPGPRTNALFLLIGASLSNFIGTTGASMLLVRPLLRTNQDRAHKVHLIIFFIFIVSNCSGLLTPLGDPPLFLGFLNGVDFTWTLRLFPQWLLVNGLLLIIFVLVDSYFYKKELQFTETKRERFGIEGKRNFFFLICVIGVMVACGNNKPLQIIGMASAAAGSYFLTPKALHQKNKFSFHPAIEVAVLFLGIFITMTPALMIFETQGSKMGITQTWQFFWMTGVLSAFLDNAPSYLTFGSLAKGVLGLTEEGFKGLLMHDQGASYLAAISCGAVFMGALTYIGNGPNFMVKAIAEHSKVKMPGFFGYMLWSGVILLPVFTLAGFIFFTP